MSVHTRIITRKEMETKELFDYLCEYYESVKFAIDKKKTKEMLELSPKTYIYDVLVMNVKHPEFKNLSNKQIVFKMPMCCGEKDDGAIFCINGGFPYFCYKNPVGDAIVVVSKIIDKAPYPALTLPPIADDKDQ